MLLLAISTTSAMHALAGRTESAERGYIQPVETRQIERKRSTTLWIIVGVVKENNCKAGNDA